MIYSGEVLNFNPQKGYGFIKCSELKNNVFFHVNSISRGGNSGIIIEDGDTFEFKVLHGPRGPKAINIKRVSNF